MADQKIKFDLPRELAHIVDELGGMQGVLITKRPDGTASVTFDRGNLSDSALSKLAGILAKVGIKLHY